MSGRISLPRLFATTLLSLVAMSGAVCADPAVDVATSNIFDPQRKPWPEKNPPPPPAPPLTKDDVQVYGIMAYGPYKKAIVRLTGKLKDAVPKEATKGRPYVALAEGQTVGAYTLEQVQADKLVFADTSGGRAVIGIEKKTDRPPPPQVLPAPVQAPYISVVEMPLVTNPWSGAGAPLAPQPSPQIAPLPVAGGQLPQAAATENAPPAASSAQPGAPDSASAAPPPNSLLEAIQAAKAAQAAQKK